MTLLSSYKERRRMRKQTLELDHIVNRIGPLKADVLRFKYAKTQREAHTLHDRIVEMIQLYHKEITDIHHIIQEAHIFTRRTEKLFKYMEAEAHTIGAPELKEAIHKYSKKFHKIHSDFETMARREYQDIRILFKRATPPAKLMEHTVQKAA